MSATLWDRSTVPPLALALVRKAEGDRLQAYLDSGKVPTIGTGSITMPDGSRVRPGGHITQQQDDAMLARQLGLWAGVVARVLPKRVPLTVEWAAALISFTHQEGPGALFGSVLADMLDAGLMEQAGQQLNGWVVATVNGVRGPQLGIMRRMEAQRRIAFGAPLDAAWHEVWALDDAVLLPLYHGACTEAGRFRGGKVTWEVHPAAHPASLHPAYLASSQQPETAHAPMAAERAGTPTGS